MIEALPWVVLATGFIALLTLFLLFVLLARQHDGGDAEALEQLRHALQQSTQASQARLDALERSVSRLVEDQGRGTRQELAQTLATFQQTVLAQGAEATRTQNAQIDAFGQQLAALRQGLSDTLATQLQSLGDHNARRMAEVRQTLEAQLAQLQASNAARLEEMRITVDEKLQATLQARLGESFRQVAERLEQVHKGLGEMQTLAQGVGDLKHLLTNVKTRGTFGEAQLESLLEQVLVPDQYAVQVTTRPGSTHRVDLAVRLPGRGDDDTPVWLPIDAKFPTEDYERLLEAQGRADAVAADAAARALETRIRLEARSIAEKYLEPPHTTDFAILFLPTEGLYAEVLRRPGLMEALAREHRVTLAGPTTLLALLGALQMGFRTLALERRASEVWQVLGAVKTEFGRFGDVLGKVRSQTETVLRTLDAAQTRSRAMDRALKGVEALPEERARMLVGQLPAGADSAGEARDRPHPPSPGWGGPLGPRPRCRGGWRRPAPLLALRDGYSAWAVGLLLALFSLSQVFLSIPAGRFADRHGLRRPAGLAVMASMTATGLAALFPVFGVLCLAAMVTGAATGSTSIAVQRQVGRMVSDSTALRRAFSWLGIGPAFSNFLGPFAAGLLIDHAGPVPGDTWGYRAAFLFLTLLPLLTWWLVQRTPGADQGSAQLSSRRGSAWDLLREPLMRRLMLVNLCVSACWDIHTFVVPLIGHERALSASAIGALLGAFAIAAVLIRVAIPLFASRLQEHVVLAGAMVVTALAFAVYPFMQVAWTMGICSVVLGMALGSVQPMVMSMLHQITPHARHGEALGLRLVMINASSMAIPLLFGAVGSVVGVSLVFWVMGATVGAGSRLAWHLRDVSPPPSPSPPR